MQLESGQAPAGWLSPWISESLQTPDLLAESGYGYTLNWCHDDQPLPMRTRQAQACGPCPTRRNSTDIPMIIARQMDGKDFAQMIIDQPTDAGAIAGQRFSTAGDGYCTAPYIVGQPYRLRHLRRALQHVAAARDRGQVWMATPGDIFRHAVQMAA